MDAYEEARRQAIAAKAAIAQELGIADQKRAIEVEVEVQRSARKRARSDRNLTKTKEHRTSAVLPRRRSSRLSGLDPEGKPVPPSPATSSGPVSIEHLHQNGSVCYGTREICTIAIAMTPRLLFFANYCSIGTL